MDEAETRIRRGHRSSSNIDGFIAVERQKAFNRCMGYSIIKAFTEHQFLQKLNQTPLKISLIRMQKKLSFPIGVISCG